jgi:hypothetical protein
MDAGRGADRPRGAASDNEEQSIGTVNEVGSEGAQTTDEGEEEPRPPRRPKWRSHMGVAPRRRLLPTSVATVTKEEGLHPPAAGKE